MKKFLPQAIALAASLGMAASAHAVNVNYDGLGQVLLYPVYTAEEGMVTAVHVTNTTDQIKAVKVRFVEGMNSQEVLDFNLYLSPFDVWTGGVVRTADGAALVTSDTSCTAGAIPAAGQPFVNFLYSADSVNGRDRARVGHLEVIEMGEVDPAALIAPGVTAGQAIIHGANGTPGNCAAVRQSLQVGGAWRNDLSLGMSAPAGGLYGTATLVNVDKGIEVGYDATALDNFSLVQLHALPGDEAPSLAAAEPEAAFKNGDSDTFLENIDAVSAVLMKENIKNDYAVGAGLNAQTDFVITFPTKRLYVNNGLTAGVPNPATAPFTSPWNRATSSACEAISLTYYDREERTAILEDEQFSPRPPQGEGLQLCYETNILGINGSNILGGEYVRTNLELNQGFETGWINIDLVTDGSGNARELVGDDLNYFGLPAIGFAITAIQNGNVGGLLSNYAGSWEHKALTTRD